MRFDPGPQWTRALRDDLLVFFEVARERSLTKAAKKLDLSQASASAGISPAA